VGARFNSNNKIFLYVVLISFQFFEIADPHAKIQYIMGLNDLS
jgi:hypothetical protein